MYSTGVPAGLSSSISPLWYDVPYWCDIIHLSGESNVLADIGSRWIAPSHPGNVTAYAMRFRSEPQLSPLRPLQTPMFVYPSVKRIVTRHQCSPSLTAPLPADGSPILVAGNVLLPTGADHLIMRVFIVTHCSVRGHRGLHLIVNIIMVGNLQRKVQALVKKCFLCRHVKVSWLYIEIDRQLMSPPSVMKAFLWTILSWR